MEGITLEITERALREVAKRAMARKIGARGLRAILENTMLELMYEVPSQKDVEKVIVDIDGLDDYKKVQIIKRED